MKDLFDAINKEVSARWIWIVSNSESILDEEIVMYRFKKSASYDFAVNLVSADSIDVFCNKIVFGKQDVCVFKFVSGGKYPLYLKSDAYTVLLEYDLSGQAKYIVDLIENYLTPPAEPA